ncbi:hypothetical protein HHI36_003129 [Cryptolaemus montrouzieri]|uniref:Cuticle protein n=1 Tax=Cryptolaemus montrouzieri TaxID=559131 RepID=A0ABD2PE17_9CUCU
MQWKMAIHLLSALIIGHTLLTECSVIVKRNSYNFNPVDQEAIETNAYNPLYIRNSHETTPNIQRPSFSQIEEEPPENTIESQQPSPEYEYGYSVNEPSTGDQKFHTESRRDNIVQGTYSLIEPDGSRRTVVYIADIYGFRVRMYRDPPDQRESYVDQSQDALRHSMERIPDKMEERSDHFREQPNVESNLVGTKKIEVEDVAGLSIPHLSNFETVPVLVEDVPMDISMNDETKFLIETPDVLPIDSKNSISEYTKLNLTDIVNTNDVVKTLSHNTLVPNQIISTFPLPTSTIPPSVLVFSASPAKVHTASAPTVVENPSHIAVTTPVPITNSRYPPLKVFSDNEFPLLAHVSPSYSKRYARYFS